MPFFIAEVSSNHHGDLQRCFQFIDKAAEMGCDAVKFQLFKIDQLFSPEVLRASEQHRQRREWELPLSFLPALAERCQQQSIQFACTPLYLQAVEQLQPYVDFYKIASYELLWDELLVACAETAKPVVLSTGMATLDEVKHAVDLFKCNTQQLSLLHCVSGYPTPIDQCNLAAIQTLRDCCGCPVGWSDHTVSPMVLQRAVHRWGAEIVEFHLDLDTQGEEYAAGHCWLPEKIAPLIRDIRSAFTADGSARKEPALVEQVDRDWRADPQDGLRPLRHIRKTFGRG